MTPPDEILLDHQLRQITQEWIPAVEDALTMVEEPDRAKELTMRFAHGFPLAYRNGAGPVEAATDILMLGELPNSSTTSIRIYRDPDDSSGHLRLKLYSHNPIALSDAVPAFENFGFHVIDEITTPIEDGVQGYVQCFVLALVRAHDVENVISRARIVADAISRVIDGRAENDRFNELIITVGLTPGSVVLFRSLFYFIRQIGIAHSMATVVGTLRREQHIARELIALFEGLHDPSIPDGQARAVAAQAKIDAELEGITSLDDDRVLRLLRAIISATVRTNFYAAAAAEALAFKLDSHKIPGLPQPLPWREIWVYSPRVEGIHLRAGPVARGGLRWSDRRDDFRTEILGLMKAQRVKNAVIVPTGAKGGFYPKQLPSPAVNREAWFAEGAESYRAFIRAMLSVTDNIVDGKVVHPEDVKIHDDEDPYFVVAADKGTATFSDFANAIAIERGFWLGDAFASGGSNGYDHKAMGITARGGWISVQRHFAEMGIDVQKEPVTVTGCGDMSGDVFGNGMLRSKAIKLVAAFDHRHIFLDPDPDPATSWGERYRLFQLPRSSWDDYDRALVSNGGGIFSRSLKSIALSPEVRRLLGVTAVEMEPSALISAILKTPVDLLWFGGIGTYVKAGFEANADVGDPANDNVRIDAEQLRAKVLGEGANLGTTQAARIAFARRGGRVNADFIDNSAGVDCSDNEVNIKIVLNQAMAEDRLSLEQRNALLASMTDAVATIVLENNRLQALGLSIAEATSEADLPRYLRLIEIFEERGYLDRRVEGLASNEEFLRREQDGTGLTRPELAVLLATAKLAFQDAIEHGTVINDPIMEHELATAFPQAMNEAFGEAIVRHQLHREIVATRIANRIVNRLGIVHPFELAEEEACSLAEVACAFLIAERLFEVPALWATIDNVPMPESARVALFGNIATGMHAQMADILRSVPADTLPTEGHAILAEGVYKLVAPVDKLLTQEARNRAADARCRLEELGAPEDLARHATMLVKLDGVVGLARLAGKLDLDEIEVTRAFVRLGESLGIDWLQSAAARMEPRDPWERVLIAGIARDMQHVRLEFLARGRGDSLNRHVDAWRVQNENRIKQFLALVQRGRMAPVTSLAMLAKLASQAHSLLKK